MCGCLISKKLKIKIFITCVESVLIYGCECWTLTKIWKESWMGRIRNFWEKLSMSLGLIKSKMRNFMEIWKQFLGRSKEGVWNLLDTVPDMLRQQLLLASFGRQNMEKWVLVAPKWGIGTKSNVIPALMKKPTSKNPWWTGMFGEWYYNYLHDTEELVVC